jgi:hypothetical protein
MTANIREAGPPLVQGVDEIIAYQVTTTPWGSSPGTISCAVFDITDGGRTDVTTTVMPVNSPTAAGDVITLSPLKLLTVNKIYRVEVKFTCSGNVFECYKIIMAEH